MSIAAPYVAVVGPGSADDATLTQAEEVGRGLAAGGAVVICGGLGGVMAGACRGASSVGGLTVGLLPGTDRAAANQWVSVAIPTGLGEARNSLVTRAADVIVAIAGEYGTLSEIAFALKDGKPVIGLGTWELGRSPDPIQRAADPADAVALALAAVG